MSTTRREILKAAPLALLSGGFAIPLLSAFTEDDLKKAEKGKVIKQEAKAVKVHPSLHKYSPSEAFVWPYPTEPILTLGPAFLNELPCEIIGLHLFSPVTVAKQPKHSSYYLLRFQSIIQIDNTHQTFILSQTI